MDVRPRELYFYETSDGTRVVERWLDSLHDAKTRARLQARLDRLEDGNFGDHGSAGGGVIELREHFGPGYRIYVGLDGPRLVILLCGGDKGSQRQDAQTARTYWTEYTTRTEREGKTP